MSHVCLLAHGSFDNSGLHFGIFGVFALPFVCDSAKHISRRFAKHIDDDVLRNFLPGMPE